MDWGFSMRFEHDPSKFWIGIEGNRDDIERLRSTYKYNKFHKKCTVYGWESWNIFSIVDFLSYIDLKLKAEAFKIGTGG